MRAGKSTFSRPPYLGGGGLFGGRSEDGGNAVMVGVVGVSNGSLVLEFSKFVDRVGAGGSSFARGGSVMDCELLPGEVGVLVFGAGG